MIKKQPDSEEIFAYHANIRNKRSNPAELYLSLHQRGRQIKYLCYITIEIEISTILQFFSTQAFLAANTYMP